MYSQSNKLRLYELIEMYVSKKIDSTSFCNDYHNCYGLELNYHSLNEVESKIFSELDEVVGRFSEFEEDIHKYPGVYFSEEQLRDKIIDSQQKLGDAYKITKELFEEKIHYCRVCGLYRDILPWGNDDNTPSGEICPCCGVEFGKEDSAKDSVVAYRKRWLNNGAEWFMAKEKPANWSLEDQLKTIPSEYR